MSHKETPAEYLAHAFNSRTECLEAMAVVVNNLHKPIECLEGAEKTLSLIWSHCGDDGIMNMAFGLMVECRTRINATLNRSLEIAI